MSKTRYFFGDEAIEEAWLEGTPLQKIFVLKGKKRRDDDIWNEIMKSGIPVQEVPPQKLRRTGAGPQTQIIAEKAPLPYHKSSDLITHLFDQGNSPRFALLDGVTDVGNFGAIARSALCFKMHGLVIPHKNSAQVTDDAIHTSSGALHYLPVCRENSILHAVRELKNYGMSIIACSEKGDKNIAEVDFDQPFGLVLGSEEKGISGQVLEQCNEHVYIPIGGQVGSLNVSAAAAVAFYEASIRNKLNTNH